MMLFDAHADILTDIYEQIKLKNEDPFVSRHLDKYKESGITHSIFVNWTDPKKGTENDFYACFDVAINYVQKHKDLFYLCYNLDDVKNAIDQKKLGVFLGVEGLKFLKKPEDIIKLYNKGIRHASLTWNEANRYGAGLNDQINGLTNDGKKIIKQMERLGMIIDLAHANEKTFKDVMETVKGPVDRYGKYGGGIRFHTRYGDDAPANPPGTGNLKKSP